MTFSWDRTWSDLVAMLRAHTEIILVLGGLFLLLPAFALALYVPQPNLDGLDGPASFAALRSYLANNWAAMLAASVASRFGEAAILAVLLNANRQTVAQSLRVALALLFPYVVLVLITNLAVALGLLLFIVPGIYLFGRLAVAGPAMFAERETNPLNAIARSLSLTRGRGWRVAGLALLILVVAFIVTSALNSVFGVLLALVLPADAQAPVLALVTALLATAVSLIAILLAAAIYRQLVAGKSGT